MGLMRKAVRRATPRPVRKAKRMVTHPVRTGIRAATPRSIRTVQRDVHTKRMWSRVNYAGCA